jgi:hypothetical protein
VARCACLRSSGAVPGCGAGGRDAQLVVAASGEGLVGLDRYSLFSCRVFLAIVGDCVVILFYVRGSLCELYPAVLI